ncbi:hypothetical protein I858_003300 [Planococcus versutus]|uniref:Uncharacterized protein n=1 Tax=Planococcus versutus TaxID=1302659 RepID=A0A1B1RYQ1_9BACL|nr:hypothetical protein I858_003300 [Planococcus versutus]
MKMFQRENNKMIKRKDEIILTGVRGNNITCNDLAIGKEPISIFTECQDQEKHGGLCHVSNRR